jgi:selenocysteine-specific elongation factor
VERHLVIGTAGHIDHGKTALVRALTGVDTDRLEEEKRRGITIDLGFAPLALGGEVAASVVDVPGHEGFIKNMVAGATGVDLALLVVAADEGVMPQTTEHLAILRFLGVTRGVVALTKCDLAPDPAWRALVADEVQGKVAAAFGHAWPVVEVSATTGAGLEALRAALAEEGRALAARPTEDRFRLPVDRAFALAGAGTIVTGTVWSGVAHEGDKLTVLPAGVEARVRSIEVHDRPATEAVPGRRTALALVGPSVEQAGRGTVVVSGAGWRASRALDVSLTMLPEAAAKLRPRLRVRVDHGTAEVLARVVLPREGQGGPSAPGGAPPAGAPAATGGAPGAAVPARLLLEAPLVARAGDRFVVRSYSPVTTIGGGVVLDPWADDSALARPRGRRAGAAPPEPAEHTDAALVAWLVGRRGARGLERSALAVAAGLDAARLEAAVAGAAQAGLVEHEGWLVGSGEVTAAADELAEALTRYHAEHPLEPGMPAQAWRASAADGRAGAVVDLAERRVMADGRVKRDGALVRLTDWKPTLGTGAQALRETLLAALAAAGAEPPSVGELSAQHPGADVPGLLRLMAREGIVVAVARDRYYEAAALQRDVERLVGILKKEGGATPAKLRDALGRSRKWLIPFLEWCDTQGITERRGDQRVLGSAVRA